MTEALSIAAIVAVTVALACDALLDTTSRKWVVRDRRNRAVKAAVVLTAATVVSALAGVL